MSRWALLKAAITGSGRDTRSSSSIHRFQGFQLINKCKRPWPGYLMTYNVTSLDHVAWDSFFQTCQSFLLDVGTTECTVKVSGSLEFESGAQQLLEIGRIHGHLELIGECSGVGARSVEENKRSFFTAIFRDDTVIHRLTNCEYWAYTLPRPIGFTDSSGFEEKMLIVTKERPEKSRVDSAGLASNILHGVDNTGNVCVWPAEYILLFSLLRNSDLLGLIEGCRLLELGGGMTAFCSLALCAAGVIREAVATDGHPDCVKNQNCCIHMCKQTLCIDHAMNIKAKRLCWSIGDDNGHVKAITEDGSKLFDVIVAADCMFFKDFHDALVDVLLRCLSPDGVVIMLQPRRGVTMQMFLEKAAAVFSIEIRENYCSEVTALRDEYKETMQSNGFDEDIHYPVLVLLRRTLFEDSITS